MGTYLVVANKTAQSKELRDGLLQLQARDPDAEFVLLVPATPSERAGRLYDDPVQVARARAEESRRHMESSGIRVVDASEGDGLPLRAIGLELEGGRRVYNGIVIATLPPRSSAWIAQSLPRHVERRWGLPIRHIVAASPEPATAEARARGA